MMVTARQLKQIIDQEVLEAIMPNQRLRSRVLNLVPIVVRSAEKVPRKAVTNGMLLELYRESMRWFSGSLPCVWGMGELGLAGVETYLIQQGIITDDRYKRILSIKGKGLDAKVHVSIPREDLDRAEYRTWVDQEVITPWLVGQEKNPHRVVRETKWNEVVYVSPKIKEIERYVGIFKADGSWPPAYHFSVRRQGVSIEQGYTLDMVERVHFVADSLEETLKREGIKYERHNKVR